MTKRTKSRSRRKPEGLQGPIIIVGAGRSGSTLLHEMLAAHSQIRMLGEFEFLTYDLWRAFWEKSAAWHEMSRRTHAYHRLHGGPAASDETSQALAREGQAQERVRVGKVVRSALAEFYGLAEGNHSYWGFKEIWIGPDERHTWEPFDTFFPDAFYVHLIRHPLDTARSSANWNRQPLTLDLLKSLLADWVSYVRKNRERASTRRYAMVQYEQLIALAEPVMTDLLGRLGLSLEPECLKPLDTLHLPSMRRSGWPQGTRAALIETDGLEQTMIELGYKEPAFDDPPPEDTVTRIVRPVGGSAKRWTLERPFMKDDGLAWTILLSMDPRLSALRRLTDDFDHPERSPLHLFEDGVPLGPAHAQHLRIREEGEGRYSHWVGNYLLFSTSDNTDPNTNGREYTLEWRTSEE